MSGDVGAAGAVSRPRCVPAQHNGVLRCHKPKVGDTPALLASSGSTISDTDKESALLPAVCVSLCCCSLDPGSPRSCCDDAYEVTVNEEVVIPLAAAVKAAPLKARKRDEVSLEGQSSWSCSAPGNSLLLCRTHLMSTMLAAHTGLGQICQSCMRSHRQLGT